MKPGTYIGAIFNQLPEGGEGWTIAFRFIRWTGTERLDPPHVRLHVISPEGHRQSYTVAQKSMTDEYAKGAAQLFQPTA